MSSHLLTKFEIQKNYQNPRFNGGYSRNNLPIIINGSYIINLDECKLIGTHWIALYVNDYMIIMEHTIYSKENITKKIEYLFQKKIEYIQKTS